MELTPLMKFRKDAVILPRFSILRYEISVSQHKANEPSAQAFFVNWVSLLRCLNYVMCKDGM